MKKPYAESCEQNRDAILSVIKPLLKNRLTVLEIGSGTGQHAVYFARKMPHLVWQPSDQIQYLNGISIWRDEAGLTNVVKPLELDVTRSQWPDKKYDVVFSANTLHIMHWSDVEDLFSGVKGCLKQGGLLIIYGPFNYNYGYTSESNARFDNWLKERDPHSGIRHFEDVSELALKHGLILQHDYSMPANNRVLCWKLGR